MGIFQKTYNIYRSNYFFTSTAAAARRREQKISRKSAEPTFIRIGQGGHFGRSVWLSSWFIQEILLEGCCCFGFLLAPHFGDRPIHFGDWRKLPWLSELDRRPQMHLLRSLSLYYSCTQHNRFWNIRWCSMFLC